MTFVLDVLFRVLLEAVRRAQWRRMPEARVSPGVHARRHVLASYRAWARQEGFTAVNGTWEGTIRGVAATVRPRLENDQRGAVEATLAAAVTLAPATLHGAEEATTVLPELTPLFADGALTRIRWNAERIDFHFVALTMPDTVTDTCAAALVILVAPIASYR